ncbi:MAG: M1 family metallopeptidase [Alphaproteobacteria bacterium]|nr:M1 family metallopeptidase [Alphaproteobacteria bacterium]
MLKIYSRIAVIIVAVLFSGLLSGCGPAEQQKTLAVSDYPRAIPKGQLPKTIRPDHYRLNLKIIPKDRVFSGRVTIDLTFDVTTDYMWIDGQNMTVSSAELKLANGKTVAASYKQVDPTGIARLDFAAPVGPGKAKLEISYQGRISDALEGIYRVKDGGNDYIYTQFEAIDARRAFPGFDEPGFKVPFDLSLTIPTGMKAVANTPETSRRNLGDGLTTVTFAPTKPLPTYLVAFAVGPFEILKWSDLPKTAVRDRTVGLRGIASQGKGKKLAYALKHTGQILTALEDYLRIPYPYKKLDILAVPDFAYGAMENAGAITYREQLLLLDENSSQAAKKRYMEVHAHEMSHQWFGDLVTPKWWNDIWLNEALATWMSQTALDNIMPKKKFRQGILRGSLDAMTEDSLVSTRQIRQPILSNDDIVGAFDGITYKKGAGVLAMIESFMGRKEFRAGLHNYLTRFAFKNASSDDFITAVGEKSDRVPMTAVKAVFNSFLDQPGIPYLDITRSLKGGKTVLAISQSRYLPLGSKGDRDKIWKIPVCFGYGIDGVAHKYCTVLDHKNATITLPESGSETGPVDYVMPDLNGAGYYRYALSTEDWSRLFNYQNNLSTDSMLSVIDSFTAAMDAGKMSFAALMAIAPAVIESPSYRVAIAPMKPLRFMYEKVAETAAEKAKISALSRKLYRAKLAAIGFKTRAGDDGDIINLRRALVGHLAFIGQDKPLRAKLATMARRYVGFGADGRIHADLVDSNLIARALIVGVEDIGPAFGRHLLDLYLKSTDGAVRGRLLQAMASTRDATFGAEIRGLILSDKMRANEVPTALSVEMGNHSLRRDAWVWFQQNFSGVKARIPAFNQSRIPRFAESFCSLEKRDQVKAFFEPRVKSIAGGSRALAQTLETIELCTAKAAFLAK